MFELLRRWFGEKTDTPAADIDPVTATAVTTSPSENAKLTDVPDDSTDAD